MQEIWKPIKEFENHYEISNFGNITKVEEVKNKIDKNLLGDF